MDDSAQILRPVLDTGGCLWARDASLPREARGTSGGAWFPAGSKLVMNALSMPMEAPSGTVALVFTDIQGSTLLWERCSAGMRVALEIHDRILRALLASASG